MLYALCAFICCFCFDEGAIVEECRSSRRSRFCTETLDHPVHRAIHHPHPTLPPAHCHPHRFTTTSAQKHRFKRVALILASLNVVFEERSVDVWTCAEPRLTEMHSCFIIKRKKIKMTEKLRTSGDMNKLTNVFKARLKAAIAPLVPSSFISQTHFQSSVF